MNLLEPDMPFQSTAVSIPPWRKDYPSSTPMVHTDRAANVTKDCKAESSQSSLNRKRSPSVDLDGGTKAPQKRRANATGSKEKRTEGIVRELKANRLCLKVEISQLEAERDACRDENNRLRLLLKEQEQAILERNEALKLLLQQPGLLLQQQQQGSLLNLPDAPVSVASGTQPAMAPMKMSSDPSPPTLQVPVCFLPEHSDGQQATVLLLHPEQINHQGGENEKRVQVRPPPSRAGLQPPQSMSSVESTFAEFPRDLTDQMHREFQEQHEPSTVSLATSHPSSTDSLHSFNNGANTRQAIVRTQQELSSIEAEIKEIQSVKVRLKDIQG